MKNDAFKNLYSKTPAYIYGFHGCKKETFERVVLRGEPLCGSTNKYDWLGPGIYFWENSYERATEWAHSHYGADGAVLGAFIDLGYCLDLTDYGSIPIMKQGYEMLKAYCEEGDIQMPSNKSGGSKKDLLVRDLDCAVIQMVHEYQRVEGFLPFDSVRGTFEEGNEMYPGAGFREKTHTQVCVRNPNCIKGYFVPREMDSRYPLP